MTVSNRRALAYLITPVLATCLGVAPCAATAWAATTPTAAKATAFTTHPAPGSTRGRTVVVPGALNVRDLGGLVTADGRRVRTGLVYRSANLATVTPAGDAVLRQLGIGVDIDFRTPTEIAGEGADKLPGGVLDINDPINTGGGSVSSIAQLTPAQFAALFGNGQAQADMTTVYEQFVTSAADRQEFAAALRTIATSDTPVLFHCSAGKDRTGWLSAVLLTTLGVSKHQVYQDYLLSNTELAASNQATIAELDALGYDGSLLTPLLTVQSTFLATSFNLVKKDYGSMYGYLTQGLGLSPATIRELQVRLLAPNR